MDAAHRTRPRGLGTAVLHCRKPSAALLCLAVGLAAACPARSGEADAHRPATGAAAWPALVGNTVTGTTADGPYADYFAPDGTVAHADRDGADRGRWILRGDALCLSFPQDDQEDCRTPEVDGDHGAFVDGDGSRYPFDILAGNPRRL